MAAADARMSADEMSRWMEEHAARGADAAPEETPAGSPTAAEIERYLEAQLPAARGIAVRGVERIGYGAAREHYGFEAEWSQDGRAVRHDFVLLRDHAIPAELLARLEVCCEPTFDWVLGRAERAREFRVLRFLEGGPVPAPRAWFFDTSGSWLARPFAIHERVPGRVAPSFTLLGMDSPAQRAAIARQFVELLAALHRADWRGGGLECLAVPPTDSTEYAARAIDVLERRFAALGVAPDPVARALDWLRARAPVLDAPALCHGDYKTDNLIFEGDRIRAIIDWEFAHLGDPLEDVGAACMPLHQSGGRCMGLLAREDLLDAYARASGRPVDAPRVGFWEVFCAARMTSFAYVLHGSLEVLAASPPAGRSADEIAATRAFLASMRERLLHDLARQVA